MSRIDNSNNNKRESITADFKSIEDSDSRAEVQKTPNFEKNN